MSEEKLFDPKKYHRPLVSLSDALRRRKLILVLGAGISVPAGLPSWDQLVAPLRQKMGLPEPGPETDLRLRDPLVVAEMYELEFGKPALRGQILNQIRDVTEPTQVHRALAELDVPAIYTTNWDQLMEKAFEQLGKRYFPVFRDADYSYQTMAASVLLVKLHGDANAPSEIVITKRDIFEYPRTHPNILSGFKDRLKTHTALLVGVSLGDPNLEGIIEQALRELKGEAPKHFLLVKGWDEHLHRYYRSHSLEPVALDRWDEIERFLKELVRRTAEGPAMDRSLPGGTAGTADNLSPEIIEEVLGDAAKALEGEYRALVADFNQGRRSSIRKSAEDLGKRLRRRKERPFRSLTAKVLLLLAQIAVLWSPHADTRRAKEYLSEAEQLIDEPLREHFEFVSAMVDFFRGDHGGALERLARLPGEAALRLRLGILMQMKRFEEIRTLLEGTGREPGTDEGWDQVFAEFHMRQQEYETAFSIMKPWVDKEEASSVSLELAGHILAHKSEERHSRFCEKHYLFRQLSLVLKHHELVDCQVAEAAADYLDRACRRFEKLGELGRAAECLAGAYELRGICQEGAPRLTEMADRFWRLTKAIAANEEVLPVSSAGETSLEQIEEDLLKSEYFPFLLCRLKEWTADKSERAAAAAQMLDKTEIRQKFFLLEEQAILVTATAELWTEARDPQRALAAIDGFVPPMEYSYFPEVLRTVQYLNSDMGPQANEALECLEREYSNNPVVLALLSEWYERSQDWSHMLQCAEKLLGMIEIPQTYDYYLTALGNLKKWGRFLEGLDRAKRSGVKLSPTWTVVNRARSYVALDRGEEAKDLYKQALILEQQGELTLHASDLLNLAVSYVIARDHAKALETVKTVVKRFPLEAEGHLMLVQLLTEEGSLEEAFRKAGDAAQILPDNDAIQATFIRAGLMTGHGEEIGQTLRDFPHRFPDSKALWMVPQEEGFRLYREALAHTQWVDEQYRAGLMPVVQAAYTRGGAPSYFRFWHASTRNRSGLYIACGEQRNDWKALKPDDTGSLGCAVFDFPALMTSFELSETVHDWLPLLKRTFKKVYIPQSFGRLLAVERSALSGQVQVDRYEALKRLRNVIDLHRDRFPIVPLDHGTDDFVGHKTERAWALKAGLPYLNEFSEESKRSENEIGFLELEALLSSAGRLSPNQQEKLRRKASERPIRPLPESFTGTRQVVADMMSLLSLTEKGVIGPFVEHFDLVHISELGWRWLLSELGSSEFAEEVDKRFKKFEQFLSDLEGWLECVSVSEAKRHAVWGEYTDQIVQSETYGEMSYFVDLYVVAAEKNCLLITDDLSTKMMRFEATEEGKGLNSVVRIGSDTLQRYFLHAGIMDAAMFVSRYDKFITWNYLHLPPEPVFIMHKLPESSTETTAGLLELLQYYAVSFKDFVALARKDHHRFAPDPLREVLSGWNEALAELLTKMFLSPRMPVQAGGILKELAWTNLLEQFRFRSAEYLRSLIASLMTASGSAISGENADRTSEFWSWIDNALLQAGFGPRDIDSAWTGVMHTMLDPQSLPATPERLRQAGVARILTVLPERTRTSILTSYIGPRLQQEFGWGIELGSEFAWEIPGETGIERISVSSRKIEQIISEYAGPSLVQEIAEQTVEGLRLRWVSRSPDSFLISVRVWPDHPRVDPAKARPAVMTSSMLSWFFEQDRLLRELAWQRGKEKLGHYGCDVADWIEAREALFSDSADRASHGGERCLDLLMSHDDVAADLITESVLGALDHWETVLESLTPNHVSKWLGPDELDWETEAELIGRTQSRLERLCLRNTQEWKRLRKLAFQSFFPDAAVSRTGQVRALTDTQRAGAGQKTGGFALELVTEAEVNPSPAFKINVALTVLELASKGLDDEDSFWGTLPPQGRASETLQRKVQRILLDGLSTPKLAPQEGDQRAEMIAVAAQWSSTLFAIWSRSDGQVVVRNRYLACIAGGFLAGKLFEQGILRDTSHWALFRRHLFGLEQKFRCVDIQPGFYRPGLARYLGYPACFLAHALVPYVKDFKARLLSKPLQTRMLEIPQLHRLFYCLAGGVQGLGECWLDSSLDKTETTGLDRLLRESAGESIEFWDREDRETLEKLSKPVEVERILEEMFTAIPDLPPEKLEGHCLPLFHMVWLAFEVNSPIWQRWMNRWLDRNILSKVAQIEQLYSVVALNLAQALLVNHMGGTIKQRIEALLFSAPDKVSSKDQLRAHSFGIQYLIFNRRYEDQLAGWLTAVAFSDVVSLETRRKIVIDWVELFDNFPQSAQRQLKGIFQQLAKSRPYWNMTELLRFVEEAPDV